MSLLGCIAPRFHLLDLETTGLDAGSDRILEVAILTIEDGREESSWSSLVDPGIPIAPGSTRIHGITPAMVRGKPAIEDLLEEVRNRLGDAPILAHNAGFDRSFLEAAAGRALDNPVLDTLRLFQDLRPEWGEHSVDALCDRMGLEPEEHRALDDCRALLALLRGLLEEEEREEGAGLRVLLPYYRANHDPWLEFTERALNELEATADLRRDVRSEAEGSPGDGGALEVLREELPPAESWFREGGYLAEGIEGFEVREEQARMAAYVDSLLAEGGIGAVEAGTGVGKTFAYLVPAMLRLARHGGRVVLSTYTKLLQDQVSNKDLPALARLLGDVPAAVVKGQSNYLCLARLAEAIEEAQGLTGTNEDREAVALLAQFARRTSSGILDGLPRAAQRMRPAMREWIARVRAAGACRPRPSGKGIHESCFYPRAIREAENAQLVVTNHAQVLKPPAAFPPFDVAILDEAHELEAVATDAYAVRFDSREARRVLDELRGRGGRTGLLGRLRRALRGEVPGTVGSVERAVDRVREALPLPRQFFAVLARGAGRGGGSRAGSNGAPRRRGGETSFRVSPSIESDPRYPAFDRALEDLAEALEETARHLEAVLDQVPSGRLAGRRGGVLREDLGVARGTLQECAEAIAGFREQGAREACRSCAALASSGEWMLTVEPIDIGRPLYTSFVSELRAGIFVSATLGLPGDPAFVLRRLGWDWIPAERRADALLLGSPFPYEENVVIGIPTDHPVPPFGGRDDRRYVEETARVILRVATRLGGRTLALFPSLRRMERVAAALRVPLEEQGIALRVGTGLSARERFANQLRRDARCVVLGSKTFMQGLDVPGKGLSCVILERIPFEPPSRPITEARCEAEGAGAFEHFQLPVALLALRQAAGRLVRRRDDRGAILLLHSGIASKGYFEAVQHALPPGRLVVGRAVEVLREVEGALEQWDLVR